MVNINSNKKKVCIVRAIDVTFISRIHKSAQALAATGDYEVTIISVMPRFLTPQTKKDYSEIRVPIVSRKLGNKFFLILRGLEGITRVLVATFKKKADIYIPHGLEDLIICFLVTKITKSKIIYNSDELEGGRNQTNLFSSLINKLKIKIEGFICRRIDVIIAADAERAQIMQSWHNIRAVEYIRNFPNYWESKKNNLIRNLLSLTSTAKIVLYQGAMVKGRGLEQSIYAISKVNTNNVVLVFLGNISPIYKDELNQIAKSHNFNNLFFIKAVPWADLLNWTSSADISLSLIQNSCLSYYLSAPNKLYESIMAEVPYIASNFPEVVRVHKITNGGILVDPSNIDEISRAINKLLNSDDFYSNCKMRCHLHKSNFSWERESLKLINIVNSTLGIAS